MGGVGDSVTITHPEKVLFPDDGITKGDLAAYYEAVAPAMLPHIRGRPVTMERYHRGIGEKGFFQKDVSRGFPAWLERVAVPKKDGDVAPRTFTLRNMPERVAAVGDVWSDLHRHGASLERAVERLRSLESS